LSTCQARGYGSAKVTACSSCSHSWRALSFPREISAVSLCCLCYSWPCVLVPWLIIRDYTPRCFYSTLDTRHGSCTERQHRTSLPHHVPANEFGRSAGGGHPDTCASEACSAVSWSPPARGDRETGRLRDKGEPPAEMRRGHGRDEITSFQSYHLITAHPPSLWICFSSPLLLTYVRLATCILHPSNPSHQSFRDRIKDFQHH